jgi:cytidine diphosphoramidate kinase
MVIWLIGMSCSGKTTIGEKLFARLVGGNDKPWVFLDGDMFRNIMGEDLGHSLEDRSKNAYRISNLCKFLEMQGIDVVACVLSLFHDNQRYNREHFIDYKEVFIDVDFEKLVERDNKGLYAKAIKGDINDVVGVDIEFKPPYAPDVIIDNNEDGADISEVVESILKGLSIRTENQYIYSSENRLEVPEKYEYSKYGGNAFLNTYLDSRKTAIASLGERIRAIRDLYGDAKVRYFLQEEYVKDEKAGYFLAQELGSLEAQKEGDIVLSSFLLDFLKNGVSGKIEKKTISTLLLLIKRFEVSKKLFLTYSNDAVKKTSAEYDMFINYPLFSLVLQTLSKIAKNKPEELIAFNAILKVNDIIVSILPLLSTPAEYFLAEAALKAELSLFEKIKGERL